MWKRLKCIFGPAECEGCGGEIREITNSYGDVVAEQCTKCGKVVD